MAMIEVPLEQIIEAALRLPAAEREQLQRALGKPPVDEDLPASELPTSDSHPVLAGLWDNDDDSAYDEL
jgi:hypothetical protein